MKVLFLTNIPSPYRVDFFQELGKLCELTVLYELEKANDRNQSWERTIVEKSYREVYLKPVMKQTSSAWCPSVINYLRCRNYDIVVVGIYSTPTGMHAVWYLKTHQIPYFLNCDGGMISYPEKSIKKRIKKLLISGASGYLSTGKTGDAYLAYYGAEQNRIYRYPFTSLTKSDLESAGRMGQADKRNYKDVLGVKEGKMILSVGSFNYDSRFGIRKGFHALMRMAEKIHGNIGIYIVGDNPTEEFLEWKDKSGLEHVHFIGFKTKEELKTYYAAADLFVLMTRYDIWGLVINEAMSFGLPIITTDKCVAGLELVKDGVNGYIVSVDDDEALAEKIMCIINDEEMLRNFGDKSRKTIQRYSIEDMAQEHAKILGIR